MEISMNYWVLFLGVILVGLVLTGVGLRVWEWRKGKGPRDWRD